VDARVKRGQDENTGHEAFGDQLPSHDDRDQQTSGTVPVVFVLVSDPVAQCFADSLTKSGSNLTDFSRYEFSIGGKWLGLLKEISCGLARVAVLFNPRRRRSPNSSYLRSSPPRHRQACRRSPSRRARDRRYRARSGKLRTPAERRPDPSSPSRSRSACRCGVRGRPGQSRPRARPAGQHRARSGAPGCSGRTVWCSDATGARICAMTNPSMCCASLRPAPARVWGSWCPRF
jgi:hypothetical protein